MPLKGHRLQEELGDLFVVGVKVFQRHRRVLPLGRSRAAPRSAQRAPIGTSLAAGLPFRVIMISDSAPLSTASTRRERRVLASSMLTVIITECALARAS